MSNKSYRIRTEINGKDKVLSFNLKQGIKTLNILSLEINPEDLYEIHTSDYGVIVGRVLANDAFGVPNVKISVFIPLDDADDDNVTISSEYPFKTTQMRDSNGIKYNVLPQRKDGAGTFPSKRMVLDNDGCIEVFDKYWKYTTTTNESGDYMIFGVPTGSCQIHYDCDLSDVGIISQHPYDFIAKGYDENLFKSKTKFTDTNPETAVHILSRDITTYVYPFWGDKDQNKIGITRNDINIDYKFEPCCIFMGSCITDPEGTYIGVDGKPNASNGMFDTLITRTGDIEVIRQTQDGRVEELRDNVKGVIDGNGVWCYQIPMNLDRIGTDEFGNRIAINDPNKGIPTRARVRFRISLSSGSDTSGGVTAKMLVPCNPELQYHGGGYKEPLPLGSYVGQNSSLTKDEDITYPNYYNNMYEFGSKTPDVCFRDVYWGKVYSVKQYYPRFQHEEDDVKSVMRYVGNEAGYGKYKKYLSVIADDDDDWNNPKALIYNYRGFPPTFSFKQSCISSTDMISGLNTFPYTTLYAGPEMSIDYSLGWWFYYHMTEDAGNERLTEKGLHFCFENDWINGCLYFPRFAYTNGDYFGRKNDDGTDTGGRDKREHASQYDNIYITGRHNFYYNDGKFSVKSPVMYWHGAGDENNRTWFNENKIWTFTRSRLKCGVITKKKTMLGQDVFYYRCGAIQLINKNDSDTRLDCEIVYRMLYSTDIILLGNLEDIYDHLPKLYNSLSNTSATFPPVGTTYDMIESGMSKHCYKKQIENSEGVDEDLMDIFGFYVNGETEGGLKSIYIDVRNYNALFQYYNTPSKRLLAEGCLRDYNNNYVPVMTKLMRRVSLFFNLVVDNVSDFMAYDIPSFINLSRICELDVHNDSIFDAGGLIIPTNGMIDIYDIETNENRSSFATMNYDINKYLIDPLGHRRYSSIPIVISGFDGRLEDYIRSNGFYGSPNLAYDQEDKSYMAFRFGYYDGWHGPYEQTKALFAQNETKNKKDAINYANGPSYLPLNSFYFYFGLKSGQSALDVLRDKYVDGDELESSKVQSIIITQDDGITCDESTNMQLASITVKTDNIQYPITYEILNGSYIVARDKENVGDSFSVTGLTAGKNYKLVITDSFNNTYEQTFHLDKETITIQANALENPNGLDNQKNELIINTINNTKITSVATANTSSMTATTVDDKEYIIEFNQEFSSLSVDSSNTLTVKFPNTIDNVNFKIRYGNCISANFEYAFKEYTDPVLVINGIPVECFSGWTLTTQGGVITSGEPDYGVNGSGFNLFDSLNSAHPSNAESRGRGHNFTDVDKEEQLSYVSKMCRIVFGGENILLEDKKASDYCYAATISPNYGLSGYSTSFDEVITSNSAQIRSIDGYVVQEIDIPHIVGSNYPTSSNTKTLLKASSNTKYTNNPKISDDSVNFGLDLFAFSNTRYGRRQPIIGDSLYPSIEDLEQDKYGKTQPSGIKGYFGIRTVDKRFDYQFACKTPLILPSGYDMFPNLQKKALVNGIVNLDLYGGFRLNFDNSHNLMSYGYDNNNIISGGPNSNASLYDESIQEDGVEINGITRTNAKIWEMAGNGQNKYNDDIDLVKYIATLSGNTSFDASFTSCGYNFEDGVVHEGDTLDLSISYESGVSIVHDGDSDEYFDIYYNIIPGSRDYATELSNYIYTAKVFSGFTITLNGDSYYNGDTYTDMNCGGNDNGVFGGVDSTHITNVITSSTSEISLLECSGLNGLSVLNEYKFGCAGNLIYTTNISYYPVDYSTYKPIPDKSANSYGMMFYIYDKSQIISATTINSFFIITTRKTYVGNGGLNSLTQGVVRNMGYAYYAGSVSCAQSRDQITSGTTVQINLYTPLRNNGGIDFESITDIGSHTIGEITDIYCPDFTNGIESVEYDKNNMSFTIKRRYDENNELPSTSIYFSMVNGLRYKFNITFNTQI